MIQKQITYCGQPATIACDERCDKAWGVNVRPKRHLRGDPQEQGISSEEQMLRDDDYEFLSDDELGEAPAHPGTAEGMDIKPQKTRERMNKWCVRECERCYISHPGRWADAPVLPDYSKPLPNLHSRR